MDKLTIKNYVVESWNEVKEETITNCFKKLYLNYIDNLLM